MDDFIIKSSVDDSAIEFSARLPEEPTLPIDSFAVKVSRCDLFATTRVWVGYTGAFPANWFKQLAENWRGWEGELTWHSMEHELALSARNDRRGHVGFMLKLQPDRYDLDWRTFEWRVHLIVKVDAGQLESIARNAVRFFGKEGCHQ